MTPVDGTGCIRRRRIRTPAVAGAAIVAAVGLLVAGCGRGPVDDASYVFRPQSSPIKVDTPGLRAQKAAAGIPDCPKTSADAPVRSGGLPAITLPCLGGGRDVDLAGLTGSPTILNFWAQSCGPCRTESPLLESFQQAAGDRVRVIGVDWQDSQPGMAIAFAKALGITYPQLADPEAATRAPLQIGGLPTTLLVDAKGTVVRAQAGAFTSAQELSELVEHSLGVHVAVAEVSR
jgi:cytochrome c biogenesis protein CcmG, thiol:disulfide interchange protein DsbE